MARAPKPMHPIDRAVAVLLADAVGQTDISRRVLSERTGMSTNRIGIILRGEGPATVGEAESLARAIGVDAFDLFTDAEQLAADPQAAGRDQHGSNVIAGRFTRMGSGQTFAANAAAHHNGVSIFDEQEQQGD